MNHTSFIICFDGHCILCNKFVDFLIRIDKNNDFYFSTLQSDKTKTLLRAKGFNINELKAQDTIIVINQGKVLLKSDAVLEIMLKLGGGYRFLSLCNFLPKFIRDSLYDFVAKRRIKWFGRLDSCRIPTSDEVKKFIN